MWRDHVTIVAAESSKYCIFLCVCVCVWVGGWASGVVVVGVVAQARAFAFLLIQYVTRRRHIVCVLSDSTTFFDITT
jgi:hypothetical protein